MNRRAARISSAALSTASKICLERRHRRRGAISWEWRRRCCRPRSGIIFPTATTPPCRLENEYRVARGCIATAGRAVNVDAVRLIDGVPELQDGPAKWEQVLSSMRCSAVAGVPRLRARQCRAIEVLQRMRCPADIGGTDI